MENVKDDFYFVKKIRDDFQFILNNTKGITLEKLSNNEVLLDSIMFRLIQVSENSLKLTEKFKSDFKTIPWSALKGMRNRIVHDYGNVDYTIIYETIVDEIPHCVDELNKILK
jgi:uncharacterized protein with HEPN domain